MISVDRLIICKTIAAGGASGVTAVVDAYHTIRYPKGSKIYPSIFFHFS